MLDACVLDLEGNLDKYLPLTESTYNNNYWFTLGISSSESCMIKSRDHNYWEEMRDMRYN